MLSRVFPEAFISPASRRPVPRLQVVFAMYTVAAGGTSPWRRVARAREPRLTWRAARGLPRRSGSSENSKRQTVNEALLYLPDYYKAGTQRRINR